MKRFLQGAFARSILSICLLTPLILTGCEANSDDEGAMVTLDLEGYVENQALTADPTTVYTLDGQALTLTSARMYLSEITLIREGGEEVTFTLPSITAPALDDEDNTIQYTTNDYVALVRHDAGEATFELGEVAAGTYQGIRFKVGLDGTTNRMDPTAVPEEHPLSKQTDVNNHWSWNAGYIFVRMDGALDLDGDGQVEATDESNWEIHLGTGQFVEVVELDETFTLEAGELQNLHVVVDYAALLAGVDFSDPAQRLCHTMDNLPVAQKVGANLAGAFMFHGIHDTDHDSM